MKRYYDDDDDNGRDAYGVRPPVLPDNFKFGDFVLACTLAVVTLAMLFLFASPWLYPTTWNELAISAGIRPAETLFPGIFRVVAHGIYALGGVHVANVAMPILGKIALGLSAFLVYYIFRGALAVIVRLRVSMPRWSDLLARIISILGAFAFICSDSIWVLGQTLSSDGFLLLLMLFAIFLMMRFLMTGRLKPAYGAMFVLGLLAAETPFGLIMLLVFWGVYAILVRNGHLAYMCLLQPFVQQVSKWFLTFTWVFGALIAIAVNVIGFVSMDGLSANALSLGDLPITYISDYWHAFIDSASVGGWIIGLGVVVMPCMLALVLVSRSTDEDVFLPYHVGIIFILTGIFAYSQTASLAPLWFWRWIRSPEMVPDKFFLAGFSFMNALTLVCALAVFAVDGYCRNHRRLALMRSPDMVAEDLSDFKFARFVTALRRISIVLFPVLMIAGIIPGRIRSCTSNMLSVVEDYVKEVVTEIGDASYIFTDGSCDAALELEAAARGHKLYAFSMIGRNTPRDIWMRVESLTDGEDRLSAQVGAPNLLRTWERDKPERLKNVALQLGFELWKRSGKTPPVASGVLARPYGMLEKERIDGVARTLDLATRVLDFYANGGAAAGVDPLVNDIFLFVQWRLARIARLRAEQLDQIGDATSSLREMQLADSLDDQNDSLKRILEGMARVRELTMRQMTPREGLQFALVRADFVLARRYAEPILDADPDDPNANFGMGMSYFVQEQFGRAEEYLRRCLKRNSKEPAVWNNIAVLQLRQGRFSEARANAQKALSLVPDSAEVKDTLKQIERAEKIAATNKTNKVSAPAKGEKR